MRGHVVRWSQTRWDELRCVQHFLWAMEHAGPMSVGSGIALPKMLSKMECILTSIFETCWTLRPWIDLFYYNVISIKLTSSTDLLQYPLTTKQTSSSAQSKVPRTCLWISTFTRNAPHARTFKWILINPPFNLFFTKFGNFFFLNFEMLENLNIRCRFKFFTYSIEFFCFLE